MGQTCQTCTEASAQFTHTHIPTIKQKRFLAEYEFVKKQCMQDNDTKHRQLQNYQIEKDCSYYGYIDQKEQKQGYGEYIKGNFFFAGTFIDNVPNGLGILIEEGDYCYVGSFKNGLRHGSGKEKKNFIEFEGQFEDDCKVKGKLTHPQYIYGGEFQKDGRFGGYGKISYESKKVIYEGYFRDGLFDGEGSLSNEQGAKYKGAFKQGEYHGYGAYLFADGQRYIGQYRNGERHGFGRFIPNHNNLEFAGKWVKNQRDGRGIVTEDNLSYFGEWKRNSLIGSEEQQKQKQLGTK